MGDEMSANTIIMFVMAVFFVIGALDRLFGNKIGMGAEFTRGFTLMGTISLSVVGLMCLAPVVAKGVNFVLGPLFLKMGADTSSLLGAILSCDIGYPVAHELAQSEIVGNFNGLICGSVIGFVFSFTIPLACGLIKQADYRFFAIGILSGYIFDPVASFVGGLMMGMPALLLVINLIPPIIIAAVIVIGLFLAPEGTMKVFKWVSRIIMAIVTVGLAAAAFEKMTGIVIIPGMNPISDAFKTMGTIVLSLAGSLPFLWVVRKLFGNQISKFGEKLGINTTAILSIVIGLTSLVPGYTDFDKMNGKGKVVFAAFSASAGCMLGAHLGVTAAVDQTLVTPLLVSKIIAGIMAIACACFFYPRLVKE